MRDLAYHGPGERSWEVVPDPVIVDPTDANVLIDAFGDAAHSGALKIVLTATPVALGSERKRETARV